ncbi:hypothetical protein JR316_0001515 [Psilocybe cubensis]|uniref:Uncharacterized protein n=2 Tax=Psilocybe cubensis TaxID=181762 RepID=A0ACB8HI42_PSICU|nr:hypothetical protein JR316_0001515 [Psilocybe cubensis]KAH9487439.1 hypothetical protein JR316_0001515 [Psilocybe cubensis]
MVDQPFRWNIGDGSRQQPDIDQFRFSAWLVLDSKCRQTFFQSPSFKGSVRQDSLKPSTAFSLKSFEEFPRNLSGLSSEPIQSTAWTTNHSLPAMASTPTRPFRYEVRVFNQESPIIKEEVVPVALCVARPPEMETRRFLTSLVSKHDRDILNMQPRTCWNCDKQAIGLTHTPASWLHLSDPLVLDFVQPVCENGGACDQAARQMMYEEMTMATAAAATRG